MPRPTCRPAMACLTALSLLAVAALAACGNDPVRPPEPPRIPTIPVVPAELAPAGLAPSVAAARRGSTRSGMLTGAGGVRLAYRVVGRGRDTAVVLHGGPGLSMSYLVDDLARLAEGRTLIYFDQRGGGDSPLAVADSTTLAPDLLVADVDSVRRYFGLRRVTLVGHSWGATLAGLYAVAHPTVVKRLVLLDPGPVAASFGAAFQQTLFTRLTPEGLTRLNELIGGVAQGPGPIGACESAFALLFANYQFDPTSLRRMDGHWCGGSVVGIRQGLLVTQGTVLGALGAYDLRARLTSALSARQVPTLVLYGDADPIPAANARAWADAIPGATLVVLHDVGHFPWLENAAAFFTTVDQFLRWS